ncbi:cytosol aminopeptidase isoform X3 [Pantherophis guttatus]|uniref:Cytosol aminopeptidase n=1 Tax=Pantherophis guttatus TaxID=94885 RepID=A0A6P9DSH1_PANGU|nr:cytosol aminopeptidase isoform X3 [Pantherophis guttatus]
MEPRLPLSPAPFPSSSWPWAASMLLRLLLVRVRCPLVAHPPRALLFLAASMTAGTRAAARQAFPNVVVVGLGKKAMGMNIDENWNEDKENIRAAVAAGCRQLQDLELPCVEVDPCGDAQAAAEGAALSIFEYEELKQKKKPTLQIQLHGSDGIDAWQKGIRYAEGQNLARYLMEGPANHITPTKFATIIEDKLKSFSSNVTVHKRDKSWIQEQAMGSFWSVAKGSDEPPVFLEVHYQGSSNPKEAPLVFVGKGITFDSGGISIKPSANMDAMRADMGGAAIIFSAIVTAAEFKLPINLIGLAPLCENLPSGTANKPGDVVTAMNGKTIQIDNTDAEGRLVLADALHYAHRFNPRAILDAATLTGAMDVALGSAATGVFTNSQKLWHHLYEASILTGGSSLENASLRTLHKANDRLPPSRYQ